ncbi:MAG: lipopolysaccharide biosynthesis protein [Burkholderiales bacterium]|nr:lipopolysaccharide biosynthesis protein [Burkholderiales bacterium]
MSTRKAIAFSYVDRYSSLIIFFLTSTIIARLLTPEQVGVFSVTMIIIGFMAPFRDLGASQYLIQEKELTRTRIQAVWAVQLFLNALLSLLIFASRNFVAEFYHRPEISSIMDVLAVSSLLVPFGALTIAWLTRELRFERLAIIRSGGALTGSAVSIAFAWSGHGPISLAYGALTSSLMIAFLSMFFRPRHFPWLPGTREISKVLSFGTSISGISLLNQAYQGTPELILGRIQGMYTAGIFSRAQGLVNLFERLMMDSIYAVALPTFSKLHHQGDQLDSAFFKSISIVYALGWSLLMFIAVMANPIINLLYGPQWSQSVDITRILCLSACFYLIITLFPALLIATGKRMIVLRLTVINVALQGGLSLVGGSLGLYWMGWGITLASLLISLIWMHVTQKISGFSWHHFRISLWKSAIIALSSMAVPLLAAFIFRGHPDQLVAPLLIGGIGMLVGIMVSARKVAHPLWSEIEQILIFLRKRFSPAIRNNRD